MSETESGELPPIGGLRLIEVNGARRLALDIARQEGKPVAVVGPGAVDCDRCKATGGLPCTDPLPREVALEYPHFERVARMNREIARLLKEEKSA